MQKYLRTKGKQFSRIKLAQAVHVASKSVFAYILCIKTFKNVEKNWLNASIND